jgi:predicted small metal-binding protein
MAKVLRCRDLGMNCPKEIRAENEEELLKLAAEHAEKDHGITAANIPPSILGMVKAAIKDEP